MSGIDLEIEILAIRGGEVSYDNTFEVLALAQTGGGEYPPPGVFFRRQGKATAAKFGMTIPSSFLHIMC